MWAYGVAAGVYLLFAVYLLLARRAGGPGGALLLAILSSALWASVNSVFALKASPWIYQLASGLDVARSGAWFGFLLILLRPLGGDQARWPTIGVGLVLLSQIGSVVWDGFAAPITDSSAPSRFLIWSFLISSVYGLVLVEQLFRGVPSHSRWGIKPLCLALAAGYTF
jgi:hypothetical protein